MNVIELKRFCGRFPGAAGLCTESRADILVYAVRGRTFALLQDSEPEKWRLSS
jgi:hypothetical protein